MSWLETGVPTVVSVSGCGYKGICRRRNGRTVRVVSHRVIHRSWSWNWKGRILRWSGRNRIVREANRVWAVTVMIGMRRGCRRCRYWRRRWKRGWRRSGRLMLGRDWGIVGSDKSRWNSQSFTTTHFVWVSPEESSNVMCCDDRNDCSLNQANHDIRPMMFVVGDPRKSRVNGKIDQWHLNQWSQQRQCLPFDFVLNVNLCLW